MVNQWLFPPAMDLPTHVVDNFGIPQLKKRKNGGYSAYLLHMCEGMRA